MITKNGYNMFITKLSAVDLPEDKIELVKQLLSESMTCDPDSSTYNEYHKNYYESRKHTEKFKESHTRSKKAFYERHKEELREKNRLRMRAKRAAEKAQREAELVQNSIQPISLCV